MSSSLLYSTLGSLLKRQVHQHLQHVIIFTLFHPGQPVETSGPSTSATCHHLYFIPQRQVHQHLVREIGKRL
jgi:hypothetical protein